MSKKVIVAEDHDSLREAYVGWFELNFDGVELEAVPDGEQLVERVRNGGYSVVLTDNEMGSGINGLEAIRRIREFDKTVPIYMLSGSDVKALALQLGATGYFDKVGLDLETIKTAIIQYLK